MSPRYTGITFINKAPSAVGTEGYINTLAQFASAADTYTGNPANYSFYLAKIDRALVYGGAPSQVHDLFAAHGWMYNDMAADYPSGGNPSNPSMVLRQNSDITLNTYLHNFQPGSSGGTQYATDPGLAARRTQYQNEVAAADALGFAGTMMDDTNPGGINTYNASNTYVDPRDPRTGIAMTTANWRKYHAEFVEGVQAASAKEIVPNMHWPEGNSGFTRGYNDPYIARIIEAANFILLENALPGMTGDNDVAWTFSFAAFREFADFCHSKNTGLAWFTYRWDLSDREYALAMYFLFNTGYDYFGLVLDSGNPATYYSMYDIDLGPATSARFQTTIGGVVLWRRNFTRGFILVNGPGMGTVTDGALGGSFLNTSGNIVSTVTLAATRGAVLRNP